MRPDGNVAGGIANGNVTAIAAVARNGVIGNGPDIPWDIPDDQARFRRLTLGGVLILGRRTHDSIGRPLPGRTTIVLTRDPTWQRAGVLVAADVETALALAAQVHPCGQVWVGGGGEVYRAVLPWTTALELTEVNMAPAGDATFPPLDPHEWDEDWREPHDGYAYVRLSRRRDQPRSYTEPRRTSACGETASVTVRWTQSAGSATTRSQGSSKLP